MEWICSSTHFPRTKSNSKKPRCLLLYISLFPTSKGEKFLEEIKIEISIKIKMWQTNQSPKNDYIKTKK